VPVQQSAFRRLHARWTKHRAGGADPTGFSRLAMAVGYSSKGVAPDLLLNAVGAFRATEAYR